MEAKKMLMDMYDKALTATDLRAICKIRGFSPEEVSSASLFETVFHSEKGIKSALDSLTQDEIILLHILNLINKEVDVTFFEYLYGEQEKDSDGWHYQSFATRYKDIFKAVRVSLVRKGVLLFAESTNSWYKSTKLERWVFRFPEEFYRVLPSPFDSPEIFDTRKGVSKDVLRRKLKQVVKGSQIPGEAAGYDITLSAGKLRIGAHEFRMKYLRKWQEKSWETLALKEKKYKGAIVHPIPVVIYVLSQLSQNEWILPDEFSRFWSILYPEGDAPDSQGICAGGWKWGYLSKHEHQGKSYYRPAGTLDARMVKPDSYLTVNGDQSVEIDIETIPYENLEMLALISNMAVVDSRLQITPDLIAIGNASLNIRNHPQTRWLMDKSSLFREVLEKVDKRWGKLVIHENLMVARVRDISLMVKIQQSFADRKQIIPLAKDFIAFPRDTYPKIQKLVEGSGYVIKTVNAETNEWKKKD